MTHDKFPVGLDRVRPGQVDQSCMSGGIKRRTDVAGNDAVVVNITDVDPVEKPESVY